MLWLIWQIWFLLVLAFAGGLATGWAARGASTKPLFKAEPSKSAAAASATTAASVSAPHAEGEAEPAKAPKAPSEPQADEAAPERPGAPAPAAAGSGAAFAASLGLGDEAASASQTPEAASGDGASTASPERAEAAAGPASTPEQRSGDRDAPGDGDDLLQIKGLGPKAAAALQEKGITTFAQIAAWSEEEARQYDAEVGGRGRAIRDDWVGQAKKLAEDPSA